MCVFRDQYTTHIHHHWYYNAVDAHEQPDVTIDACCQCIDALFQMSLIMKERL